MGLPQLDFRVPEATWFKSALSGRFGTMPGLSSTGALAWPYKIAVVAVMALVACGTLVTFGSAGAETPSSAEVAALPGTDEAAPTVEGQVIPPASTALLNSSDLLSSLNLTDYTPSDLDPFSLSDDDDDSDDSDNSDDDNKSDKKKTTGSPSKPGTKTSSGGSTPSPSDGDDSDSDSDEEEVEGPKHKQWREDMAAYEDDHEEWEEREEAYDKCMGGDSKLTNLKAFCKSKEPGDEPDKPDEPDFTS